MTKTSQEPAELSPQEVKRYQNLLIEDVLDRYQQAWPKEAIPRSEAKRILQDRLNQLVEEIKGPGAVGLYWDLGPAELGASGFHPMFMVPRLAGRQARQHLAYRLREIINSTSRRLRST